MEYYVRSLTLINRPAFLDRSGWSDIRRGITCVGTELKAGESKRILPFSTNTSKARNNILNHIVFKRIRIESYLNDISSHFQDDNINNTRSDDVMIQMTMKVLFLRTV
jgi:hypothetical protein